MGVKHQDIATSSAPGSTPTSPVVEPWYRGATREQWKVLIAAMLGWMLDSFDFVIYLMAITTLQHEFKFGKETAGMLASVALLTSAAGGLVFGVLADRIGRVRALMATILIYSLCSLGTATAQSLVQLVLWRAMLGLGMGGEWSSGAVLVSETWPAAHRGKAIGIMQSGWAIGYILAALVAAAILPRLGWRWLFVAGALPALLVFWVRRGVREPELWTSSRQPTETRSNPMAAIFGRALIARTVLATLVTGAVMFGYWGLFTWLPAFLASPVEEGGAGMSIVRSTGWIIPMQAGAFIGFASFGFVSDRLGRKLSFIIYLVGAAALVPIYGQMATNPTMLMALGPLLGFFGNGYFSVFGAMLAELFPTSARATGQGFTYNSGRALSALAPATIGLLATRRGIGPALAVTSAFFLIGALMILLMPETRGRQLEA
jgi:MFS family permease